MTAEHFSQNPLKTVFCLAAVGGFILSGCVRVAGTAGYWRTGQGGRTISRRAGFDTGEFLPDSKPSGKIAT